MYWYQYLLYMLPAYLLVLIIQIALKNTVNRYSSAMSPMTGAEAAALVLRLGGVSDVNIGQIRGDMTDNYDPSSRMIYLSSTSYAKNTVTAVGVAAHEAGHAMQYNENYGPAVLRQSAVRICNIGSRLSVPLMIAGYVLSFEPLIYAGLICFLFVIAFQLITLPVEFNASRRAVKALEGSGRFTEEQLKGVKKVLTAAAMTYVGALALSTVQLLYNISRFRRK